MKASLLALFLVCLIMSPAAANAAEAGGKTLIIYYSHSGNTRTIAEALKEKTHGDLYAIETVRSYPSVYKALTDEAKRELEAGELPALKNTPPDLSAYDLILVGGPVWWYTVSTPLMSFLRKTDFAGKKVAPFCTHGGGMGQYMPDFKKQTRNGRVLNGFSVLGQDAENSDTYKALDAWLEKLSAEK